MAFFRIKNSDIFHISAQNIDCGYSLEPPRRGGSNEYPQSMFLSRSKEYNVYPCKPQFYYIKVGFKGSKLYRHVFVMVTDSVRRQGGSRSDCANMQIDLSLCWTPMQKGLFFHVASLLKPQCQIKYIRICATAKFLIRIFTGRILDRPGCKVSSCGRPRF